MTSRALHAAARTLACATLAALAGCQSLVADLIVKTPNHGVDPTHRYESWALSKALLGIDRELFVTVDHAPDPPATIRAWIIEPDAPEPRGTVLVLHGIKAPSWIMRVKGSDLAGGGYRVVMVDLRGHGGSTGDWHRYGATEARDVSAVIDALEREGLIAGRLGVWGVSYGAATGILLAAQDERIDALVAVTPFTTLRAAAHAWVRHHVPFDARWSDAELDALIDDAAERAGFDADAADTRPAMRRMRIPVLIVGGETDHTTPIEQSWELFALAPPESRLVLMGGLGHFGVGMDWGHPVRAASLAWFDRYLAGDGARTPR